MYWKYKAKSKNYLKSSFNIKDKISKDMNRSLKPSHNYTIKNIGLDEGEVAITSTTVPIVREYPTDEGINTSVPRKELLKLESLAFQPSPKAVRNLKANHSTCIVKNLDFTRHLVHEYSIPNGLVAYKASQDLNPLSKFTPELASLISRFDQAKKPVEAAKVRVGVNGWKLSRSKLNYFNIKKSALQLKKNLDYD